MGIKLNLLQVQNVVRSYVHVELSACICPVPNWPLEDLCFNPSSFTNSITLGKSLNFAGPNFLLCKNWEQVDLDYINFQVPSNSITMT